MDRTEIINRVYIFPHTKNMEMNKQEIVETLRKNLSGIADVALMPSIHQGIESDWSLSIMPNEGEQAHETLGRIFKIDIPDWKEKFNEATFGQGNEINRILTLHSSALLALLCFSHVSEENPLFIDGIRYNERWFEIKNKVFNKPSSIDVVLKNTDGDILFIESKFTEYLDKESPNIKIAYFDTYRKLLPLIPNRPLQLVFPKIFKEDGVEMVGFTIQPTSKSKIYNQLYLSGIKQCISHLIGIANGPVEPEEKCWGGIDVKKIRFATICYRIPSDQFNAYRSFYAKTIGQFNAPSIKNFFQNRVSVIGKILTYQEIFKKGTFKLPREIRTFLDL